MNNSDVDELCKALGRVEANSILTIDILRKFMATLNEWLDTVLVKVTEANGKTDSMIVMFNELKQQIIDGLGLTPEQETKLTEITDTITAQTAKIDAAINTNPT